MAWCIRLLQAAERTRRLLQNYREWEECLFPNVCVTATNLSLWRASEFNSGIFTSRTIRINIAFHDFKIKRSDQSERVMRLFER